MLSPYENRGECMDNMYTGNEGCMFWDQQKDSISYGTLGNGWGCIHNRIEGSPLFMGFAIGCLIFGLRGFNRWTIRDTFLSVFPDLRMQGVYERDLRMIVMILILAMGVIPMAIDGFTQLLVDSYESNNPLRIATGFFREW